MEGTGESRKVFNDQLKVLKMLRTRPAVRCAQLEAYTDAISDVGNFFLFHGDLILARRFMETVENDPIRHYTLVKQTGIDMRDTFTFLSTLDIGVFPFPSKMVVDRSGKAIFGLIEDMYYRPGLSQRPLYDDGDDSLLETELVDVLPAQKAVTVIDYD